MSVGLLDLLDQVVYLANDGADTGQLALGQPGIARCVGVVTQELEVLGGLNGEVVALLA